MPQVHILWRPFYSSWCDVVHFVFLLSTDVNECELDVQCHPNATCVDTVGSYMCACDVGYQGDGVTTCSSKFF